MSGRRKLYNPPENVAEIECEACEGTGLVEDEIHMHTLVRIVRLECTECDGAGVIEIEEIEA